MCRLTETCDIYPAYRDEDDVSEDFDFDGDAGERLSAQESNLSTIFPQEFINNSQMVFLIIKRQLMLLIHANYCLKIDSMFPDRSPCLLRNCDAFKGVLEHLKICNVYPDCPIPRCVSSRNILRHYCNCFNIDCHICF